MPLPPALQPETVCPYLQQCTMMQDSLRAILHACSKIHLYHYLLCCPRLRRNLGSFHSFLRIFRSEDTISEAGLHISTVLLRNVCKAFGFVKKNLSPLFPLTFALRLFPRQTVQPAQGTPLSAWPLPGNKTGWGLIASSPD